MTNQEAIELLDNLVGMIEDNQNSDYDKAFKMGIEALGKQGSYEQILWERDIAIKQLEDIGLSFGEKTDRVKEALEKQAGIERALERLDKESNFFHGEPMGTLQKSYYCRGIEKAIEIIKEEVG